MRAPLSAIALAAALALTSTTGPARAGQTCEPWRPTVHEITRSLDLASRTAAALDTTGAQVVLIARAGQDLSRWRLRYSHLGWALKTPQGWRIVHKLNTCGSARGDLYRQGLAEFLMDDLHDPVAAYAVPSAAVQAALAPLLADAWRVQRLHEGRYSMVAYPWAQRYQQSNQWALETLALALEPTADSRERAQAWLRFKGYEPTVLRIAALTRLGARAGSAHISFDDHPNALRYADHIETVTVDSVLAWLERAQLAGRVRTVR
jgi:hypothetical protein